MNKRKIRIVGWALGLSMAMVGAGVATAVSNAGRQPIATLAVEQPYYTFATAYNEDNTAYGSTYDVDIDDITWNVPGNQKMTGYVRIGGKGGKNASSVSTFDRVITGKESLGAAITKVKVNHNGVSNAKAVVNSVTLKVASNSGFTEDVSEITVNPEISVATADSFTFTPEEPATEWAKDSFYKITFNITITGSSNYGLDVTSIIFYQDVVSDDYATNLSAPSSVSPVKGDSILTTLSGLEITAQKNGGAAAAYSNYSATITRRDDTVEEVLAATVFKTGDKNITLTANDPTVRNGSTYATCSIATNVSYTPSLIVGNSYAMISGDNVFTCTVTSNIGGTTTFSNTPSAYGFKVEDGLYSGTVCLKILSGSNADKYISWTGTSAQLAISDTKTAKASWVAFNDGEDDVLANASNEIALLRFNSTRFCAYTSATGVNPDFMLLGTPNTDTFNADYMKMSSYDPDKDNTGATNACYGTNGSDGYYAAAKTYYNTSLSNAERALICDEYGLYADAYARLQNWATACGDSIDSSDNYILKAGVASTTITRMSASNESLPIIIAIVSGSLLATGGFFLIQRKHKKKD